MQETILVVDDEKHTRDGLQLALQDEYEVYCAANGEEAFNLMEVERFDVILTDLRMAGVSGMSVIEKALTLPNQPICVMITAYGNVETAVEAMKKGAYDFITKPVNLEKLEILIKRALQGRQLESENVQLKERLDKKFRFDGIVGSSRAMEQVMEQVRLVAPARTTVLIEGETGTGKELVAQSIHQNSNRASGPFVAVHCAALSANILESELFGHEKGAFTGASERRKGRFEVADGGTLFLDEIGEIDASTQVKLLRFLETKTFERLGSTQTMQVDVRLVCATNRDLAKMVGQGDFREDLLYRLNVVTLPLPSLRQRKEDIALLLDHFLMVFAQENDLPKVEIDGEAMQVLMDYGWPGNVRELRNFCENQTVMRPGLRLGRFDLEQKFHGQAGAQHLAFQENGLPSLSKKDNEKKMIHNALRQVGGNRTEAAQLLGISRRTLHRKLKQWPELDVN